MKKDIFLSFIIIIGLLSIIYLAVFFLLGLAILIAETVTQSGTEEYFYLMMNNSWLLVVTGFFSILFLAYKSKHEKNKKRKKSLEKYSGSLIGKPL